MNSEFDLTSGWETIKNNVDVNQSVAFLDLGSNELPLIEGDDGEQVCYFLSLLCNSLVNQTSILASIYECTGLMHMKILMFNPAPYTFLEKLISSRQKRTSVAVCQ